MTYSRIVGTGSYLPPRIVTNDDLAAKLDTSDAWIQERTGIRQRHIADASQASSDLALEASNRALAAAGVNAADIDLILVATSTPDFIFPSTACLLQAKLGVKGCAAFDVQAVCSGFVYALATADSMIKNRMAKKALVVGAEVFSRILDWNDRGTAVLFGDGAGAVVVSAAKPGEPSIIDFEHEIDGSGGPALCMPAGGSSKPSSHETIDERLHYVKQEGQAVFRFAVRKTEEISRRLLARNGLEPADIDLFVSHQANRRIIQSATEKLGVDPSKVVINIERFGNTTAATIPLALNDAIRSGRLKKGQLVLLASVGAGFTVGAVLLRWGF